MVSVIIPTYNREATIESSIYSVLNQTYSDIEVIIIDDGSIDSTQEIVLNIKDSRVRYYYQKNQGACVARNFGIEVARGDYIAFHDSDDICRKERIEKQLDFLNKSGASVVFCAFQRHGHKIEKKVPNTTPGVKTFEDILYGMYVSTQTILGRKEIFTRHKFDPRIERMQDYDIMIRIAETEKIYFQDEILVDVFLQEDSISKRRKGDDIAKVFCEKYPDFSRRYPKWRAILLSKTANERTLMGEDCTEMFKEICKIDPSIKNITKFILTRLNLLSLVLKYR